VLFVSDLPVVIPFALAVVPSFQHAFIEITAGDSCAFEAAQLFLTTMERPFTTIVAHDGDGMHYYARVMPPMPLGVVPGVCFSFNNIHRSNRRSRTFTAESRTNLRAVTIDII